MATVTSTTSAAASIILSFMLLSTLIDMRAASTSASGSASALGCTPGYECYFALKAADGIAENAYYLNRKILMGVSKPGFLNSERPNYGVGLRVVPSGPDPLHHSGAPQKRPRISP